MGRVWHDDEERGGGMTMFTHPWRLLAFCIGFYVAIGVTILGLDYFI